MKSPAIILYDHVFKRHCCYNESGEAAGFKDFDVCQKFIEQSGYREVYVNSKEGRKILARIGARP